MQYISIVYNKTLENEVILTNYFQSTIKIILNSPMERGITPQYSCVVPGRGVTGIGRCDRPIW